MTDQSGLARASTAIGKGGDQPFWRVKSLEEMTQAEWESLCDGCARCCLNKLQDDDTGEIAWTSVACRLLDTDTCRCTDYAGRAELVPDCIQLDPEAVRTLSWLPPTCAYRLVAEGRDLYWWHPLVSGDPATVHAAGVSVSGKVVSETFVPMSMWEDFLIAWPAEEPASQPAA
jgi:uncharacterized cysteine cluster protein YcgN (CxxCxxCC family)